MRQIDNFLKSSLVAVIFYTFHYRKIFMYKKDRYEWTEKERKKHTYIHTYIHIFVQSAGAVKSPIAPLRNGKNPPTLPTSVLV